MNRVLLIDTITITISNTSVLIDLIRFIPKTNFRSSMHFVMHLPILFIAYLIVTEMHFK